MKTISFFLAWLLLPFVGFAQVEDEIEVGSTCSIFGESVPERVTLFESESEAEDVIKRIVSASGLAKNFIIRAGGVPNAAAVIQGEDRYIIYEPYFMKNVRAQTATVWAAISIMAHEIGHHLNGHTLKREGSRPKRELEADYFSGFILEKLGASLDDARKAMDKLGSPVASETHPAKNDRLVAITQGWSKACESDPKCQEGDPAPEEDSKPAPTPEPEPESAPKPAGLAAGYPTSACGCWGYVNVGATRPNSKCASGYDSAVPCAGWCTGGGVPWQTVCK